MRLEETPEQIAGLLALAERCEAANGADRELDALIAPMQNYRIVDEGHPLGRCCYDANGILWAIPRYTASLDEAMTLMPDGLRLMLSEWDDKTYLRSQGAWQAVLTKAGASSLFDEMVGYRCDHAANPALAVCTAALRAHAATLTPQVPV